MANLVISIDYDDTYTAEPMLWAQFIGLARAAGATVICVTGRKEPPDFTRNPPLPASVPIICAGNQWKRSAAEKAGYAVNIWIDDMPEMVAPSKILDWQ